MVYEGNPTVQGIYFFSYHNMIGYDIM